MNDIEKIDMGLRCCLGFSKNDKCPSCPYVDHGNCDTDLYNDILLKLVAYEELKNRHAAYLLVYNANNKDFVDSLTEEDRQFLIDTIKHNDPGNCLYCPCFAWETGEDGTIRGYLCTLGGKANRDGKGQCNFER